MVLIKSQDFNGDFYKSQKWIDKERIENLEQYKKIFFGKSRFDIRPNQLIESLLLDNNTLKLKVLEMKWGWQPNWAKGKLILNTRKEGVVENRLWGKALRENRCIIPVTHFYEWQRRNDSPKNVPWIIKRKSYDYMFFAGLWNKQDGNNSNGQIIEVSIITESGNKLLSEIHNHGGNFGRQPVFLSERNIMEWLNPNLKDPYLALGLLRKIEDGEYEAEMLEEIGNDTKQTPPKPRQPNLFDNNLR